MKAKPLPQPQLIPHTDGRWQVIDPWGYVVFCGSEKDARRCFHSHWRPVVDTSGSLEQAIRRLG